MSLAKRIEARLAEGVSPRRIAYELGCRPRYVHELKWRLRNPERYRQKQRALKERKRRAKGMKPISEILWPKDLHETVVYLKKVEGLSASQIAKITGKSRNAIIGHLWRTGA